MAEYIMRVVKIGGGLTVTIPRALVRELGWRARDYVLVGRDDGRAVTVRRIEEPHSARTYRRGPTPKPY